MCHFFLFPSLHVRHRHAESEFGLCSVNFPSFRKPSLRQSCVKILGFSLTMCLAWRTALFHTQPGEQEWWDCWGMNSPLTIKTSKSLFQKITINRIWNVSKSVIYMYQINKQNVEASKDLPHIVLKSHIHKLHYIKSITIRSTWDSDTLIALSSKPIDNKTDACLHVYYVPTGRSSRQ